MAKFKVPGWNFSFIIFNSFIKYPGGSNGTAYACKHELEGKNA